MSQDAQRFPLEHVEATGNGEASTDGMPQKFSSLLHRRRRAMRRDQTAFRDLRSKLRVRCFASKLGLPVPALYWAGRHVPRHLLPQRVVVKPNFGSFSRGVYLLEDDFDHMTQRACTGDDIHAATRGRWMLAEEFLPRWDGSFGMHTDYKVFVFGETIPGVQVLDRRRKKICWYTKEWVPMPPLHHSGPRWSMPAHSYFQRPKSWEGILHMAGAVGRQIGTFVRVDCYESPTGPVFGEISLTPNGIRGIFRNTDSLLGALWRDVLGDVL